MYEALIGKGLFGIGATRLGTGCDVPSHLSAGMGDDGVTVRSHVPVGEMDGGRIATDKWD